MRSMWLSGRLRPDAKGRGDGLGRAASCHQNEDFDLAAGREADREVGLTRLVRRGIWKRCLLIGCECVQCDERSGESLAWPAERLGDDAPARTAVTSP